MVNSMSGSMCDSLQVKDMPSLKSLSSTLGYDN
jgi:hypothetical protein